MTSPPTSTPRFSGRNAGIDLLRGLSILLVILQHTGLRIPLTFGPLTDHIPHWVRGFAVSSG